MSGSVWIASYVILWFVVLGLAVAVIALLRQIGVLHARLHPLGANFAGEGPALESQAPELGDVAYDEAPLTLLAFTSASCEICKVLEPSFDALRRGYPEVQLREVALESARSVFDAFNVRSTPYAVAVDAGGVVRGRGVVNSLEQIEELLETAVS
jgi:hypothetical protein